MTRADHNRLRAWHPEYQLRFTADGRTLARTGPGRPWGLLYTREQTERAAEALRS